MENNIQNILDDLYKIDNSFRAHEGELIKIIEKLLAARPEIKLDEEFVSSLRARVLNKARELSKTRPESDSWFANYMNISKLAYALAGAAITLVIALPVLNYMNSRSTSPLEMQISDQAGDNGIKIARLKEGSFGDLVAPSAPASGLGAAENSASAPAVLKGSSETAAVGRGGGGGMAADSKMISMPAPGWVNYQYKFTGSEIPVPDPALPVYNRLTGQSAELGISSLAQAIVPGILDVTKFRNLGVTNFNVVENRDFGYNLYFDVLNGNMNIDMQWDRWPQPERNCRDQACFDQYRLKIDDVPGDEAVIAISDAFLNEYNIDRSIYGAGQVNNQWRQTYDQTNDKSQAWIPDVLTVIYPLIIEGKAVYEESGYPNGLSVNVSIRYDRVTQVYGLKTLDFASSEYAMVTDTERIKRLAENGGNPWSQGNFEGAETVTLELGDPTLELVWYWRYNQDTGRGDELYVPAYVFPILNKDKATNLYRDKVVVILSQDIMDERDNEWVGIPEPMPLLRAEEPAMIKGTDTGETMEVQSVEIEQ